MQKIIITFGTLAGSSTTTASKMAGVLSKNSFAILNNSMNKLSSHARSRAGFAKSFVLPSSAVSCGLQRRSFAMA